MKNKILLERFDDKDQKHLLQILISEDNVLTLKDYNNNEMEIPNELLLGLISSFANHINYRVDKQNNT